MRIKIETPEQFLGIVPLIYEYAKSPKACLSIDVETYGPNKKKVPRPTRNKDGSYNGHIRTLQIGLSPNVSSPIRDIQYIIDVKKLGYELVGKYLKDVLENTMVLGQNLKYEYQFLFTHMGIRLRKMRDVMLMSQILFAGDKVNHGLGDLYGRFLDYGWFESYLDVNGRLAMLKEPYKEIPWKFNVFDAYKIFKETNQTLDWEEEELTDEQLDYAADDVALIFPLFDAMCERIRQWREIYETEFQGSGRGMLEIIRLECSNIPAFALMELRGIKLNKDYHNFTVIKYLMEKQDEAAAMLGFTVTKKIVKKFSNRWCGLKDRKEKACVGINRVSWEEVTYEEVPMNMRSPAQLKPRLNEILRDALQDPELEIEGTGEDVIKDLVNKRRRELPPPVIEQLRWILQYKKASSLLSKFGQKMIDLCTDRDYLHASWFQIGTDESSVSSGRSSCKSPNMMQMPSRGHLFATKYDDQGKPLDGVNVIHFFRRSFIAEEGWILLDADYSQEEPRIAAETCNELPLIEDFRRFGKDSDIHSIIGKSLCGLDYYPKKGSYERDYIGKTGGLQLLYGAYWKSLKDFMYSKTDGKVDWDDADAEQAYNRFFEAYPSFRREMDKVKNEVQEEAANFGWTLAPFKKDRRPFYVAFTKMGRARRFCLKDDQVKKPDFMLSKHYKTPVLDEDGEPELDEKGKQVTTWKNIYRERMSAAGREGFNHRIQGTAADILKIAIQMIEERFEQAGFDWQEGIVAVIHDEILCHVKLEHADIAAAIMRECMIEAWDRFFKRVPMFVDVDRANNWADAKEPPKKPALSVSQGS